MAQFLFGEKSLSKVVHILSLDDQIWILFCKGIALLYLHLYEVYQKPRYLKRAEELIQQSLRRLRGRKSTFLLGDGGPLAIAAVIYDKLGKKEKSKEFISK